MRKICLFVMILTIFSCAAVNRQTRYNEYAFKLVDNGLYEEALYYLNKADALGDDYRVKNNMALCFEALGNTEKAHEYYKTSLRLKNKKAARKNYEAFTDSDD